MVTQTKLTQERVKRAKYEGTAPRRHVVWDTEIRGFGLRVYPSGRKSFVLSYRAQGRKRLMVIGDFGDLTLAQARKDAQTYRADILHGKDPLETRQKQQRGETVKALCEYFIEHYSKPRKKSWKDDERYLQKHVIPAWGSRKADSVTQQDVATLHRKIGQSTPYAANRTLEIISKMYKKARTWQFVDKDYEHPVYDIERFTEKKRDRYIKPQELPELAKAIDAESNMYARFGLWLYLLTGLRKNELLRAKWSDVDLHEKEIKILETKNAKPHYLPLSDAALALLQEVPKTAGNPYILPGLKKGRHLVNIDKPWQRVRKVAGVEDVRLHDLRRTVGSWLAQSGNTLHLIGRVLNHKDSKSTEVYARLAQDTLRDALNQHGARIMGIAGKGKTAEVVEVGK